MGGDYLTGQRPGYFFSTDKSGVYDLKISVMDKVHYDEKFGIQLVHYTNPNYLELWLPVTFVWYMVSLSVSDNLYNRLSEKNKKVKYLATAVELQSILFLALIFIYMVLFT